MNVWGVVVLVVVLAAAIAFGIYRTRTSGRPQPPRENDSFISLSGQHSAFSEAVSGKLGSRATLVQFSTVFCQPCRATRRILDEVRSMVDGVEIIHVDAEDNLELVRELDVRRTPTILVLDASGAIVKRAVGQPRKADVIAAIGELA